MKDLYKKRLEKVIAAIETGEVGKTPVHYNQRRFISVSSDEDAWSCDTSACIAGTALIVQHKGNVLKAKKGKDYFERATEYLGLSYHQAWDMFYANAGATSSEAVKMLKRFVKTGKVPRDWAEKP